jgi:hypothetical protein
LTELEPPPRADIDEFPADDADFHKGGEAPDNSAMAALQLAHRAVHKFPELTRRYQKFIGTAAVVSSAVIVLASIAVSRRLHHGESPDKILNEITSDEIENAGKSARPAKPNNGKTNGRFLH